jgi:DNA-binding LytR/AlgR family response regulator
LWRDLKVALRSVTKKINRMTEEINSKYTCLIVDDEPIARQIVRSYVEQMPMLTVVQECKNALDALTFLQKNTVNIVFLDINMPALSGLSMVKTLSKLPQIIFTTAYHEHAVESYELNATDYLLKPFSFERFAKAVFKAIDNIQKELMSNDLIHNSKINSPNNLPINSENTPPHAPGLINQYKAPLEAENPEQIFIKADGKLHQIYFTDILFCEAMKNYTRIVLKNGNKIMPLVALSKIEEQLPTTGQFLRVHRSFIVAKTHIEAIEGNIILIGKASIPIGEQFREGFFKTIGLK